MKYISVIVVLVFSITGCHTNTVRDFKASDYSGAKGNKAHIAFIEKHPDWTPDALLKSYLDAHQSYSEFISKECSPDPILLPSELIPIISSFGKLLFDLKMEKKLRQLEALKKSAQGSYSARTFINLSDLEKQKCIILTRYNKNKETKNLELGLLYVAKIISKSQKNAFVISPIFIRAENSAVVTSKGTEVNGKVTLPAINTSLALSLKSINADKIGIPTLTPVGEGAVSVPNLEIGPNGKEFLCNNKCPTSDLIPYPKSGADPISFSLSLTETGIIGINFDERSAEIKAIKEALGPALKDSIKEYLTEE